MQRDNQSRPPKSIEPADYVIAAGLFIPFLFDMFAWRKGWKTASTRFGEFLIDPKTRLIFTMSWTILTLHLFFKIPLPFQSQLKKLAQRKLNK